MKRLSRWWWRTLLRLRGWPDPDGTLDWLEARKQVLPRNETDHR